MAKLVHLVNIGSCCTDGAESIKGHKMSEFRKILTFRVNDSTPDDHVGRRGEITFKDGFLYYHDGNTPGGEIIGGGGSGGGGPTSWNSITGKPSFAAVATSGAYADLIGKPAIPSKVSDLTNDSGFITSVAWADISNKPNLFSGAYADLTGKPTLFSGSYTDLTNKPTIPSLAGYATEAWVNSQNFGSGGGGTGAQGPAGADGQDGASAYEVAVANGFIGNESEWLASLVGAPGEQGPAGAQGPQGERAEEDRLVNGAQEVVLDSDGTLTTPAGLSISKQLNGSGVHIGSSIQADLNKNLRLQAIGTGDGSLAWQNFEGDANFVTLNYNQSKNIMITVGNAVGDGVLHNWLFASTGNIQLPPGGDIVDIAGNSVLGGTSLTAGTGIDITDGVISVAQEVSSYKGFSAHYGRLYDDEPNISKIVIYKDSVTPNSTIDTTTEDDDFSVTGLSGSDVVAMFVVYGSDSTNPKATAELKTFTEAVIDNVILDEGVEGDVNSISSMKSAFYDNYETLATAVGGNLYSNFQFHKSIFAVSGSTSVREGSGATFTVQDNGDTTYAYSVTTPGTNYLPGHKIIFLGSTIGGVDGVNDAIFTVASVDGSGGVTSVTVSGTAAGTGPGSVEYQNQAGTNIDVGSGFTVTNLRRNSDGTVGVDNVGNFGSNYVIGDVITIPGSNIADSASPENDITLTVNYVWNGQAQGFLVSGSLPSNLWPSNYIDDGGSDQYDTGNYIDTDLATQISYNNGDVVSDASNQFGSGSSYVVVYNNSIFGVLATGAGINTIGTSGNSGFDGDGRADTGSVFGASGVDIGDFVFNGRTLTVSGGGSDADLWIKAPDDLYLDALEDDVIVRANDDIRFRMGFDFAEDDYTHEIRFADGHVTFYNNNQSQDYGYIRQNERDGKRVLSLIGNQNLYIESNGGNQAWKFEDNGNLTLPYGGDIKDSNGNSVLGSNTGNITFDDIKIIGAGSASGDGNNFATLELVPDINLYNSNQYVIIDPTAPNHIHIRAGGTQDSSSAELILGGESSHVKIGSGLNPTLYIKSNDNQWTFGTDGNLILPTGGDILDSNGTSVLGGSGGSGTTLPLDAAGVLKNDGTGTLSWSLLDIQDLTDNGNLLNFTQQQADWEEMNAASPAYIQNKPTIITSYYQLSDLPTLFNGDYLSLTGTPSLANVATTGMYGDLTGTPTSLTDFTNDPGFITAGDLAVSTGGSGSLTYSNGLFTYEGPTIPTDISELTDNTNLLSGSGFSGSYNDLTDKPTIPSLGALTVSANTIQGGVSGQVGSSYTKTVDVNGNNYTTGSGTMGFLNFGADGEVEQVKAGWTVTFASGETRIVAQDAWQPLGSYWNISFTSGYNWSAGNVMPVTFSSPDYVAGSDPTVVLSADTKNWTFGTDGNLALPAGGDIVDSNGTSVLGGGGTTLPSNASGYLNNDGSGTLSWVPGNPGGSGLLPYSDVKIISNTTTSDWTEFTLSGTMDSMYDFSNSIATITLTSSTAYGKTITANTKNLWVVNAKINSTDNLVVEFPPNPAVGDIFSVVPASATQIVTAGSFVVGETYTIVSVGTTNWTSIGAAMNGIGQVFVATGAGTGTGTASTSAGAKKLIYKPASGQRARTMNIGNNPPVMFGQGGSYDFMYVDLSGQHANQPATWVYAGLVDGIPTWYHTYF